MLWHEKSSLESHASAKDDYNRSTIDGRPLQHNMSADDMHRREEPLTPMFENTRGSGNLEGQGEETRRDDFLNQHLHVQAS